MKPQSYDNYLRFYAPHHFVFYPAMGLFFGVCCYFSWTEREPLLYVFMSLLVAAVIWLSFMMRQHYALTLQDRIIRVEMRYRYFTLTGKRLEEIENQLSDSQLFALRFASDDEFLPLLDRALKEKISSAKIRKAIKNWKADIHRV